MKPMLAAVAILIGTLSVVQPTVAQNAPTEAHYYRMVSFPLPDDVVLEVGGLDWLDKQKKRLLQHRPGRQLLWWLELPLQGS